MPPRAELLDQMLTEDRTATTQVDLNPSVFTLKGSLTVENQSSAAEAESSLEGGSVVAAGEATTCFDREEDSAAVNKIGQQYQSYVLSFNTAAGKNTPLGGAGGGGVPSANTSNHINSSSACDELVHLLNSTTNLRSAVTEWLQAHPNAINRFTAEDVGRVISSVPFSMDQPCVALAVAKGMGKQSLTCAHVAAACNAASFFRVEVAVAMVPYVSDPHNKDYVLQLLPLYDQSKVSNAF